MVLFAHITSSVEGDKYQDLLNEKGGRGFPYLAILDADGNVVARPGSRDVAGFAAAAADGKRYVDLKAKKDPSVAEQVDLLALEIGLGLVDYDAAKARADALKDLDDALRARLDDALLPLEVQKHLPQGRNAPREAILAAGKTYAGMFKAGRIPKDDESFQPFFILMLDYAEETKDVDLFRTALGKLTERFGENPRAKGFFDAQQARLAKLESEAGGK